MRRIRGRQMRTLHRIFERPRRADVRWSEVVSLLKAMGAQVSEGKGSRVRVLLNETRAVLHRPHPADEINKAALASIERFLKEAGVRPEA